MADFRSIKPYTRSDIKMSKLKITEEFLILKLFCKMYEDAMNRKDYTQMLELSVDIAESAENLEQMTVDHINGH
jgi:hypothetical protein